MLHLLYTAAIIAGRLWCGAGKPSSGIIQQVQEKDRLTQPGKPSDIL